MAVHIPRAPTDGAPSPRFGFSLLGSFELTGPEGVIDLPSRKLAGLLAYLACTAPRPQSRDKLSALLWGSYFDAQARQNLRQALFRLRKILGEDALQSDGEAVSLNAAAVLCDVARFETLVREGGRDALRAAADLYRGRLVDDVTVGEEGWNEWLTAERERLLQLALGAMMGLGELELAAGRAEHALKAGQRAVALDNLREDAHRLIVRALAATGRKAEALRHYQDLVTLLKRELNTEPDAATRSLVAGLRSGPQPPGPSPAVKIAGRALPQADQSSIEVVPVGDVQGDHKEANAGNPVADRDAASSTAAVRFAGTERRQLTILVCNMVESVPLAARLDPEEMHELIAAFHNAIAGAVARFDGFVAQYLGDGAHVYFGYPVAREHDAEQAVRAGLAILDAVGTLKAPSGVTLRAGIGIATGLVVVGERPGVADKQRVAIGETPDLATLLRAAASPGEVVIAASTRRLVGRTFDCRALPAIEVAGLPQPVEAWQVRGETAGVSRFEARRTGALAPLVGRQEEIELLLRRWNQARLGEGRIALLSGEPGIGKSRIAESLLGRLDDEPHARLRYFCSPHHTHSPLHPFIAQLEHAAGFEAGSAAGEKFDKLATLLKPTAANPARDVALFAELLGLPADQRYPAPTVDAQQKREMTLRAVLDQLHLIAARTPVLIVLEDAHWIDPTSLDLLDRLVTQAANMAVLLVVTFRPEFRPAWVGQPHVTMLPLSRLGRRDSADIIAGIAADKALPDVVVEQVLAHADGVPLFIEELTRSLLESGLLREEADRYVLDGSLPRLAIPTTLQASLVARLDRLDGVKDVAQIGAAIGRQFSHELIGAVASLSPTDLDAALERLTGSGLISRRGMPPEATYTFRHALVQDAAYATMIRSRRRQLHASIAEVLVGQFPKVAETLPEVVARHFTEAGLVSEAIAWWLRAGRLANARSANREAVTSFDEALQLLDALPESQLTLEQGCDLRLELRPLLHLLGEGRRLRERLREAEALADRLNDNRRRGLVCSLLINVHTVLGELDEALAAGARALGIAQELGDLEMRIRSTNYLAQAAFYRGDFQRVVELASDSIAALPVDWAHKRFVGPATLASVYSRCFLHVSLAELGRFAEGARYQAEAIALAEPTQHAPTVSMAYLAAGLRHFLDGDWAEARSVTERWIAVTRTGNVLILLTLALSGSAWVLARLGERGEALNRLREAEQNIENEEMNQRGLNYQMLGRASLHLDRLDEAQRLAALSLQFSPSHFGFAAHTLHLLGDIATHPDRFDAKSGEAHYRQAMALAEPRGMRLLMAHCHLGLGKLSRRTGKRTRASGHLNTAAAMYREMEVKFWLAEAKAEMLQLQER